MTPMSFVSALESLGFPFISREYQALAGTQKDSRCSQRLTSLFFFSFWFDADPNEAHQSSH